MTVNVVMHACAHMRAHMHTNTVISAAEAYSHLSQGLLTQLYRPKM